MIRWMIVIFVMLVCLNWFAPFLRKLGLGRLPGDLRFKLFGRDWNIPLATTVLLSFVATLVAKLF
jgi:Protein of unknown function (DUF2905)